MSTTIAALWDETRAVVGATLDQLPTGAGFNDMLRRLTVAPAIHTRQARMHPVVDDHLCAAIAGTHRRWQQLGELLGAAAPELRWVMSYAELPDSPELAAFRDHYCYTLLAGPPDRYGSPPIAIDDALVGFTLQAPGVVYPAHHHEPEELYGVMAGPIDWRLDDEPWTTRHSGEWVVHASDQRHAMTTRDAPGLTWFVWPRNPNASVTMPGFSDRHS